MHCQFICQRCHTKGALGPALVLGEKRPSWLYCKLPLTLQQNAVILAIILKGALETRPSCDVPVGL